MKLMIGSAPDSWGVWFPDDPRQIPWDRCLDEIAEAGYEWTELGPYGYLPTDIPTVDAELSRRGLKVSGTFAMDAIHDPACWLSLDSQVKGACESVSALGGKYLILIDGVYIDEVTGNIKYAPELNDVEWQVLIDKANEIGKFTADNYGIRTVFHPHAGTHVEYEPQIERFIADSNPEVLGLCLDTGHHAYRGGDPVAFYRKHHARVEYLHIKSIDPVVQQRVADEGISFGDAVSMDMFVEPAEGAVDFDAFLAALKEFDFEGYAIVEQDMYPAPFDKPLPIAKRTRAYLRENGFG